MNYPTEKQIHNKLNKFYKQHYGELDTDEWYVNPNPYTWKFIRNKETITLKYDIATGKISATHEVENI